MTSDSGYHKTITLTLLAPSPTPPFALSPFRLRFGRMPKPDKNDIKRLSRGESTRGKIGNCGIRHGVRPLLTLIDTKSD